MPRNFTRIVAPSTLEPLCPAGLAVAETEGGSGCRCRIERHTIASAAEPNTLAAYCYRSTERTDTGEEIGYTGCPTWRKMKEATWAAKNNRSLLRTDGDLRAGHPEDRERDAALALAQEMAERA